MSLGVGTLRELAENAAAVDLVQLVDERLYSAKHAGRNRLCDRDSARTLVVD